MGGGQFCTVCLDFCDLAAGAIALPTSSGNSQATVAHPDTFFVQASHDLVMDLAAHHPEAAMLLVVLSIRAATVDAIPPVTGNGGAPRLMTAQAVAAVEAGQSLSVADAKTLPLPSPAQVSNVEWSFKTVDQGAATLTLSHALLDAQGREVLKPYRNVEVQLRLLPNGNNASVWTAVSWRDLE